MAQGATRPPFSTEARPQRAAEDQVLGQVLEQHFGAYQRALLIASLFALLSVWLLRNALPHLFLAAWLTYFAGINLVRIVLGRRYRLAPESSRDEQRWRLVALTAHATGGSAWGILGAATIMFRPESPEYSLIFFFVFALFATFQVANPSRYPPAYYAWVAAAMGPTLLAALMQNTEVYRSIAGVGLIFVVSVSLVGRHSHRLMMDAFEKQVERTRLLESLIAQKDALDEASRAKTRFLAAASHDLRQPMQAVVLLVESLLERAIPENRRIVESIRTSIISMSALLNAILDVSKFDAGTVKVERSHFPVAQALDRLRNSFSYPATQKYLSFRVRRSAAIVETDSILLYRILANLCNNALQYTQQGGILVGCRRRADGIAIEVWDTGVGIPEDKYQEIFREFHQLANPQRDRTQGLGLGLAIVERTAELLGHRIEVKSRVGRGSMFAVVVPYGDAAKVREREAPSSADILDGCTVLVIEDEAEIRAAMTILLEGWRCKVLSASSGTEADALLLREDDAPDVVLADYRLPGPENGIQIMRRLRRRFPGVGGVLITGDIGPETLREAEEAGYQILHKPLRPARLRALLGSLWRARLARRQWDSQQPEAAA
jgi:signal transduction histidine kinase/CheY-like chemotaxis protein